MKDPKNPKPKQGLTFREIRYNDKRRKILENAAKLFAKKGYEKATIEEIAAGLKLTKASLYHYMKSKEEMLFHIQMMALDQANRSLIEVLVKEGSPVEKLRMAIKRHVEIVTKEYVIGTLRQQEMLLPRKWRERVVEERDRFERGFMRIIQEGVENGLFERKNWKVSALAALGALNWIPRWYSLKGELSSGEIGEVVADFIIRGLSIQGQLAYKRGGLMEKT